MSRLLPLLYGLTGATSLAYQLVWTRSLCLAFGATLLTTSAVVASFLGGLALGSLLLGGLADRVRRPLRLYALLELLVAAYAASSPWLLSHLRLWIAAELSASQILAVSALFLLPPTFLMGGTFPAVLAALRDSHPRPAALLYGANTAGAVAGVLVSAFFLMPRFGMTRSLLAAAALNLAAALAAACLPQLPDTRKAAPQGNREPAAAGLALVALALSGAAALVGEIAWMRALALVLGSSVYAYALVLAAFLLGIGLGSLHYSRRISSGAPLADFAHFQARAAAAALAFALLIPAAPALLIPALRLSGGHPLPIASAAFAVAFLATVYATTALGAAFPAGIAAAYGSAAPGRSTGLGYAANTVGAVSGSLLAAAWLIPGLGLPRTLAVGVTLNLAAAAIAQKLKTRSLVLCLLGSAGAMVLIPAWWGARWNRQILSSGVYAYAHRYAAVAGDESARSELPPPPRSPGPNAEPGVLWVKDGHHANVSVLRGERGELALLIDGKADASTALDGDMRTQLLLGHLPALLHRGDAQRALVIGLGSGVTASALARHPLRAIDVIEIEPAVVSAARQFFFAANRGVLEDPRVTLHIADGRNWVGRHPQGYDIITSEPSNLWMSGVTSLFTAEFFLEARRALRPGGVLCQWMHLYQVSADDVQTVLRGLARSFPHRAMFVDGPDLLVLAGSDPLPAPADLRLPEAVAADLEPTGLAGDDALRRLYAGGSAALLRFAGEGPLHTDDFPRLEFSAPLSLARDRSREIVQTLLANREAR